MFGGDKYLWAAQSHRFSAISTKLATPVDPNGDKAFIVQFEFRPAETWECSGGYLKFFSDPEFESERFSEKDQYTFMFGPDRCGEDVAKVHFIIARKDPKTGNFVEHHMTKPPVPPTDQITHFYQLEIDNEKQSFNIFIDTENVRNGTFFADFEPPLQPPKRIPDPKATRPRDWVTLKKIPDPKAKKVRYHQFSCINVL